MLRGARADRRRMGAAPAHEAASGCNMIRVRWSSLNVHRRRRLERRRRRADGHAPRASGRRSPAAVHLEDLEMGLAGRGCSCSGGRPEAAAPIASLASMASSLRLHRAQEASKCGRDRRRRCISEGLVMACASPLAGTPLACSNRLRRPSAAPFIYTLPYGRIYG